MAGDSQTRPGGAGPRPFRKGYHRRAPRACDECRLRKIKCDGALPCGPCSVSQDACSYDPGTRPRQTPTQRIRKLEACLRSVRLSLQQLKAKNQAAAPDTDIDTMLTSLDSAYPDQQEQTDEAESGSEDTAATPTQRRLTSMMGTTGQIVSLGPWQTTYYGPYSGYSFIWKTLELFQRGSLENSLVETHKTLASLFNGPLPNADDASQYYSAQFQSLPTLAITSGLLDVVFSRCHPVIQFVHEGDFRDMVRRLYSESALQFGASSHDFMPLFHAVLAIGLLFDVRSRNSHGCEGIVNEATRHFLLARKDLDVAQCADLTSLQTLLCLILFLLSTSRLTSAHTYVGVAWSSALKLGLHKQVAPEEIPLTPSQRSARLRVLLGIMQFDTFLSLVLDMPVFVDPECLEPAVKAGLRPSSLRNKTLSGAVVDEAQAQYSAAAKQLDLLTLTAAGLRNIRSPKDQHPSDESGVVDSKKMNEVEEEFRKWAKALTYLPVIPDSTEPSAIVKYELEMAFYFGQFVLYQPFLHYLIQMANGSAITKVQSQHALACIKIAATTIARSEVMHRRELLTPASWNTIYTLFQAVMCLLFLIATHNGTSRPSEAWKKGELGIRLLAAMRCFDNGAVRCLWIIKMVIKQLSHTVLFDVDHIVATTQCRCPCSSSGLTSTESLDRRTSASSNALAGDSHAGASGYATPETPHDVRTFPSSLFSRPGIDQLLVTAQDSPRHDADYILAEAQAITMTLPIDNLDGFGANF